MSAWEDVQHIAAKVRNYVRRGYLLKVYTDGKILKGRVKMGHEIENDKLDILHPVGYVAHVKPGEKVEVVTMDIGGDSSRRVIIAVVGDREYHPKPNEGEAYFYSPGDKKKYIRVKTKSGSDSAALASGEGDDEDHPPGIHMNADDQPISIKTQKTITHEADDGMNWKAKNYLFKGTFNIDGDLRISGEAYKPTGPEWKPGDIEPTSAETLQKQIAALADKIAIDENGDVKINGNLVVTGNLNVAGSVTATGFNRV